MKKDDSFFSASATDCTGLIPSGGNTDDELENYAELYPGVGPLDQAFIPLNPTIPVPGALFNKHDSTEETR